MNINEVLYIGDILDFEYLVRAGEEVNFGAEDVGK